MSRQGYHYWSILRAGTNSKRRSTSRRSQKRITSRRQFSVETLEARYLLSADPLYSTSDAEQPNVYVSSPPPPLDLELLAAFNNSNGGSGGLATDPFVPEQAFSLHSLQGATKTIYLDFTGHLTENTQWNIDYNLPTILTPAFDLDDNLVNFSVAERMLIHSVWQRVSEDFLPFQVNVTTEEPDIEALRKTGEGDEEWGQRVVIGGDSSLDWFTPVDGRVVGGVSYGSFNADTDLPNFVFGGDFGASDANIAEVVSHETGHALGLAHDGEFRFYFDLSADPGEYASLYVEYYDGHGLGSTSWAPIMGVGYGQELTQWSRGEYFNATNNEEGTTPLQDDLAIITSQNGFDYRQDDHGSTIAEAAPLDLDLTEVLFSAEGIIERNTDSDYFSFDVLGLGEVVSFDVNPFEKGANLDVIARIYDSSGLELYRTNPVDDILAGSQTFGSAADGGWAQLDAGGNVLGYVSEIALVAGTYYLAVEGAARPITFIDPFVHPDPPDWDPEGEDPLPPDLSDWGYSNYGSLGYYSITGTRKFGLVTGVDFDAASGASPLNWTLFSGGGPSATLTDLVSEPGFTTAYDLTISTTGTTLQTLASANPIPSDQLPVHSLPLDELRGYLTAGDGETLSFVWSDLDPDTVYQIFVFGHADVAVQNEVTVTGGYWNGDPTQNFNFTQTVAENGMAVNGDNAPGGKDLSTLTLLVISNEFGEISIDVTDTATGVVGIAGVAIATTEVGSLQGQKWNDNGGGVPTEAGDGGGSADPGEEGLPGWVIYLDLDNDGELDMESTPNHTIAQSAPEVPQVIPDAGPFVKNELIIAESGTILDVNVTISITHSWVSDLNVYLVGPDGTTRVKLVADEGGSGDNFINTRFDDAAATSIIGISPVGGPYTGSWRPEEPLSAFIGKEAAGKWTLEVRDDQFTFQGTLTAWSIEVEVEGVTNILEPFQITDSEGNYAFEALKPGLYYVREYIQEQQAIDGWRQSWAAPPVLVTSGGEITGIDFGNWIPIFSPGSVAGQVFNDLDGDGEQDAEEPGLEDWTVYIDANNNGVRDVGTVPVVAEAESLPKAITDFSTVTSSIMVDDLGAILKIEVTLDITHSFMADVEAFLTSPTGRIVELFSGVGAQFNNFQNMTFSDDAERSITTISQADVPYTGTWQPEVPLVTFFGDETAGLWTLTIRDTTFADEGTLNSWSLSVTTGERFAITNEDGNYEFDNIPPGQYIVREERQSGWQQTLTPGIIDDGFGNLYYNVSVNAGNTVQANFGNQSSAPELLGDFNRDNFVNAADYVMFRKLQGTMVDNDYDGADGSGNGSVGPEDLDVWVENFGRSLSGGGGGGGGAESRSESGSGGSVAAATLSAPVEQSVAIEIETTLDAVDQQTSAASSFGNVYSLFASSTGSLSSSSDTESSQASAETIVDAALVALLNSLDDSSRRLDNDFAGSSDAFDGSGDDDLAEDYGDAVEGIDALFELIGA